MNRWKDRLCERLYDLEKKTEIQRVKIVGERNGFHGRRMIKESEDVNVVVEKILEHLGLDLEFVYDHINLVPKEDY